MKFSLTMRKNFDTIPKTMELRIQENKYATYSKHNATL